MADSSDNPSVKGEIIYANKNNVKVYREASITTAYVQIRYKKDNPVFNLGEVIGEYSGKTKLTGNEKWYSVTWVHTYKKLSLFFNKTVRETLEGWVIGDEITTLSGNEQAELEEQAYQEKLDKILAGDETTDVPKPSIFSAASLETAGSSQSLLYVAILGVGGYLVYRFFQQRKKAKAVSIKKLN